MMLANKNAVVYGGGGFIGSGMARAFAREGARVFLAGRTLDKLEQLAEELRSDGGFVETAQVDALDQAAVDKHADDVVAEAGTLDISVNVITHPHTFGTPMAEMSVDDFMAPIETAARTTFLTAQAAARHMIRQGSGVILVFGGGGDPARDFYIGGTLVAFEVMETMRRQLSAELGRHGVRVVTLTTNGIPSTPGEGPDAEGTAQQTMLGRAATLEDVGNAAVFAASDWGRMVTAATVNISGGALIDR
jgi:3-oxoacyl-[acyl-carrier protein] reductase